MRDLLIMTHTMDFCGGPESGSWYERGHHETEFVEELAVKKGLDPMGAYHVLLTREEWNEIERKLDEHYEYERFELEGG